MSKKHYCGVADAPPHDEKIYAERDIIDQGPWYLMHVSHMTSESLHSKSEIAAELAHRDIRIRTLEAENERLQTKLKKSEAECEIKGEFLRTRQCADHSGKWERGRCLQCEIESLREAAQEAAEYFEWLEGVYFCQPDSIPTILAANLNAALGGVK